MFNALNREAILELMQCGCREHGWPPGDHEAGCPRPVVEWLLAELAKPREERRDYQGRVRYSAVDLSQYLPGT